MLRNVHRKLSGQALLNRKLIYVLGFMVFFWSLYDSTMAYVTPLLISENNFSNLMLGVIYSSSSVAGATFDFLICKIFKNAQFRRYFLIMFVICSIYPLLLWHASTFWFYVFVMGLWGIYFDFYSFGIFDFVSRHVKKEHYAHGFGFIQIFRTCAFIIGPLLLGFLIVEDVRWEIMAIGLALLSIAFMIFLFLLHRLKGIEPMREEKKQRRKNFLVELILWRKLGRRITPALLITFFILVIDAFFWTLGPLYSIEMGLGELSGLFIIAYTIPMIITGSIVGKLALRFKKFKLATVNLIVGSLVLATFMFWENPVAVIATIFISSFFTGISYPAINSIYTEYISEKPSEENEIEGLEDFSVNLGYVVGPVSAGFIAQYFGIQVAFSVLGCIGVLLGTVLFFRKPKVAKEVVER